jgi:uncharacterized membrane protein (UPF0127 family)
MKGKIFVGLLLGVLGAIYAFLVYPLLQNTSDVTSNEERSIVEAEQVILNEVKDLNNYQDSSPSAQNDKKQEEASTNTICFQEYCFSIEIADTFASRQQGLMNRSSLQQDAGMLFVFDTPGSYGFWMKNTLIPLDIIWMDENFVVVDTATMTPCTADPCPTYNHS